MSYQIIWEKRGIYVRYLGFTNDDEIAKFAQSAHSDERFDAIRYVLHDFRECDGAEFSQLKITEISAIDSAAAVSNARIKLAVVTDRPDVIAMAKAYMDAKLSPYAMRIFSDIDDSRAWLSSAINS